MTQNPYTRQYLTSKVAEGISYKDSSGVPSALRNK